MNAEKCQAFYSSAQNIKKVHSGCRRRFKRDLCVTQSKSHWPRLPVPACISPLHEYNTCLDGVGRKAPLSPGDPTQDFNMRSSPLTHSHTHKFCTVREALPWMEVEAERKATAEDILLAGGDKFAPFRSWESVI